MQLLVDDGVPSRGHRKNIFNSEFNYVGIAVAGHPQYGKCCILDYSGQVNNVDSDDHEDAPPVANYEVSESDSKPAPKKDEKVEVQLEDVPEPNKSEFAKQLEVKEGKIYMENGVYSLETTKTIKTTVVEQTSNTTTRRRNKEEDKQPSNTTPKKEDEEPPSNKTEDNIKKDDKEPPSNVSTTRNLKEDEEQKVNDAPPIASKPSDQIPKASQGGPVPEAPKTEKEQPKVARSSSCCIIF